MKILPNFRPVSGAQTRAQTLTARFLARRPAPVAPLAADALTTPTTLPIPGDGEILVIVLPCDGAPRLQIIADTLEALQSAVAGHIEAFPLRLRGIVGVCNEEFVYERLALNRQASLLRAPGVGFICGDVVIAGDGDCCFASVSELHVRAVEEHLGLILEREQTEGGDN